MQTFTKGKRGWGGGKEKKEKGIRWFFKLHKPTILPPPQKKNQTTGSDIPSWFSAHLFFKTHLQLITTGSLMKPVGRLIVSKGLN